MRGDIDCCVGTYAITDQKYGSRGPLIFQGSRRVTFDYQATQRRRVFLP